MRIQVLAKESNYQDSICNQASNRLHQHAFERQAIGRNSLSKIRQNTRCHRQVEPLFLICFEQKNKIDDDEGSDEREEEEGWREEPYVTWDFAVDKTEDAADCAGEVDR